MNTLVLVLRLIHIVSGVFWVAAVLHSSSMLRRPLPPPQNPGRNLLLIW